ncbi:MAG: radical SAM protein [Clostridiales bacterium]|jgi:DNA repair photolyase|nr:radical SAM protein [Clostridiales bacterium]
MEYVEAKTIVQRAKNPSFWFGSDYNMNIYRGCCHGCIYCDSRSECYHIDDFDTVRAKKNAIEIIRDDLRRKVKKGVVSTGAMSDPYNPFEKELLLTRKALTLLHAFGFGVAIATKSDLVTRDIDILSDINENDPVIVKITITSLDDRLTKLIEVNAPSTQRRFEAIKKLSQAGIFSGLLLMPVLPFILDNEENILGIVEKAHEAGARFIYPAFGMTIRNGQREYYYDSLDKHFPGLKEKYIKTYRNNYTCTSRRAKKLWAVFTEKCDKYGILYDMRRIISAYKTVKGPTQLDLF